MEAQVPALVNVGKSLFKDVDVNALDKAIDILGQDSGNLSDEQRKSALTIVNKWEHDVTDRIRTHGAELSELLRFFGQSTNYYHSYSHGDRPTEDGIISFDRVQEIAASTGTLELYNAWKATSDDVKAFRKQRPQEPDADDPDMTPAVLRANWADYQLALVRFETEVKRRDIRERKAWQAFHTATCDHPTAAEFCKTIKSYLKKLNDLEKTCNDKGQLAKLNVTISSEISRSALKDLLDFCREF